MAAGGTAPVAAAAPQFHTCTDPKVALSPSGPQASQSVSDDFAANEAGEEKAIAAKRQRRDGPPPGGPPPGGGADGPFHIFDAKDTGPFPVFYRDIFDAKDTGPFPVFYRDFKGKTKVLQMSASDTVKILRRKIDDKEGFPCWCQVRMAFAGRQICGGGDDRTISSYMIGREATIHLTGSFVAHVCEGQHRRSEEGAGGEADGGKAQEGCDDPRNRIKQLENTVLAKQRECDELEKAYSNVVLDEDGVVIATKPMRRLPDGGLDPEALQMPQKIADAAVAQANAARANVKVKQEKLTEQEEDAADEKTYMALYIDRLQSKLDAMGALALARGADPEEVHNIKSHQQQ